MIGERLLREGTFSRDERAATAQIGAVFLFGFLILGLTFNQAVLVPNENRQVEFNSYQNTVEDVESLWADVTVSAARNSQSVATLESSTRYPSRVLAINPPPATWRINTSPTANVTISNARSTKEDTDLREYWDGSDHEFETQSVRFDPGYNHLNVEPLGMSGELAYRELESGVQPLTSQTLLVDDRITVVTITGDLNTVGSSTDLVVEPMSASTERLSVTGDGGNLNITIPSKASAATWESDLLAGNPHVVSVTDVAGGVRIELDGSQTYELRLARVELRERNSGSDVSPPDAHYIYRDAGHDTALTTGQNATLIAEVRDRLNNPVSGVDVTFTEPAGATKTITTGPDGHAEYTYEASGTGEKLITAEFGGGDLARETTTFVATVASGGGGGGGGGLGVGQGSEVAWSSGDNTADLTQEGGLWTGIQDAEHINIYDPRWDPLEGKHDSIKTGEERFRLVFVIEQDVADRTGTTRYMFALKPHEEGYKESITDGSTVSVDWDVSVYKDASYNGDASGWTSSAGVINQTYGEAWYRGTRTLDLLDSSTYSTEPSYLSEVKTFMSNNDVTIHFADVDGRVQMTVE